MLLAKELHLLLLLMKLDDDDDDDDDMVELKLELAVNDFLDERKRFDADEIAWILIVVPVPVNVHVHYCIKL